MGRASKADIGTPYTGGQSTSYSGVGTPVTFCFEGSASSHPVHSTWARYPLHGALLQGFFRSSHAIKLT